MIENNGKETFPPTAAARNVGRLSQRLISLTELQAELLAADAKEAIPAIGRSAGVLLGGAVVGLSSVPVLLISIGYGLHEWAQLPITVAFLLATLIGMVVATVFLFVGWKMFRNRVDFFQRSRHEFRANVLWLKRALHHPLAPDEKHPSLR